jgi:hypothetical protein
MAEHEVSGAASRGGSTPPAVWFVAGAFSRSCGSSPRPCRAATLSACAAPWPCCSAGRRRPGWSGQSRRLAPAERRGRLRRSACRSTRRSNHRARGRRRGGSGGCVVGPGRKRPDPSAGAGWKLREFASRREPPRHGLPAQNPGTRWRFRSVRRKGAPRRPFPADQWRGGSRSSRSASYGSREPDLARPRLIM